MTGFSASIRGAGYGRLVIIPEFKVDVPLGRLTVLLGPNGAGKTTVLKAIAGTVAAQRRDIHFQGRDLSNLPTWRLAGEGIAFVPDGARCFPNLTVEENLRGALRAAEPHSDESLYRSRAARVHELFPILKSRSEQIAGSLSGGQRQMLGIGRALMIEPRMIILDEPSAGLAPLLVEQMFEDLARIKRMGDTTILMAEQNVAYAQKIADDCVLLEEGRVALRGSSAEVFKDERLRAAYLGL